MQFGQLAGSDHINQRIYDLFKKLDPRDIQTFVRKFRTDSDTQNFHTFRELILGAHLRDKDHNARYEHMLASKTPDWTILNPDDSPIEIIDVVTLHQRKAIDTEIATSINNNEIWRGWTTIPPNHLLQKIETKANAYTDTVNQFNLPYIVAAFSEFTASINPSEVEYVLYDLYGGYFSKSPWLSGLIFFHEKNGIYEFVPFANLHAAHPSNMLSNV